jgi:hypothetical protein
LAVSKSDLLNTLTEYYYFSSDLNYRHNGTNIAIGSRVRHLRYGKGIVNDDKITAWEIYFEKSGKLEVSKRSEELEFSEQLFDAPKSTLSLKEIEKVLKFVLEQYNALEAMVPLGERWKGGTLIVQPANSELQSKEIPRRSILP